MAPGLQAAWRVPWGLGTAPVTFFWSTSTATASINGPWNMAVAILRNVGDCRWKQRGPLCVGHGLIAAGGVDVKKMSYDFNVNTVYTRNYENL